MATIKLKNGSGAPLATDLVQGEPALDLTNKRLYTEDTLGAVIEVGVNPTELNVTGNITVGGTVDGRDVATDGTKLDGVESGATADQTAAEIRTLVDSATDSNVFTDADHTKLDGIEANATADQTAAEIRTLVDSATDSNVFTDADHTKLDGIEASATADQTDAEIRAAVEAATDSNVFTDADHTKLDGIEASADVTDTTNVTAAGALMDSEVTNLAQVKAFDSSDYATAAQGTTADSAMQDLVDDTTPQLGGDLASNGNDILFADNDKAIFGAGSDLEIFHNGTKSLIDNNTGNLEIRNNTDDGDVLIQSDNGSGGLTTYFLADGSTTQARIFFGGSEKLKTTSAGVDVTGTVTADGLTSQGTLGNWSIDSQGAIQTFTRASTNYIRASNASGALRFDTGGSNARLNIANNGDISFYEDTGTTAKLFWDASAERLGIGTSSPTAPTDIRGANTVAQGRGQLYLSNTETAAINQGSQIALGGTYSGTNDTFFASIAGRKENATSGDFDGYLQFATRVNGGGNVERMRIDSSGNVGIGTTTPSYNLAIRDDSTSSYPLSLESNSMNTSGAHVGIRFGYAGNQYQKAGIIYESTDATGYARGKLLFALEGTADASNADETDAKMAIDYSGNVGIGTSSPASKLDINGDGTTLRLDGTANTSRTFLLRNVGGSAEGVIQTDGNMHFLQEDASKYMRFSTANTERMRIDSSGNVGIGTTNPDGTLHISGTGTAPAKLIWERSDGGVGSKNWTAYIDNTHDLLFGKTNDSGTLTHDYLHIQDNGNVGIGTSSPNVAKMHVESSSGSNTLKVGHAAQGVFIKATGTVVDYNASGNSAGIHAFSTGNTERMRIDSSGNLLVGTTTTNIATEGTVIYGSGNEGVMQLSSTAMTALYVNRSNGGELVQFRAANSTVGSIGTASGDLTVGTGDTGLTFEDAANVIHPINASTGAARDDAIDLGKSAARFKDLYLSGGAYLGGTSSVNKLDDYEEGTWTPELQDGSGNTTTWAGTVAGHYTKVGNKVTAWFTFSSSSTAITSRAYERVSGLPFANSLSEQTAVASLSRVFDFTWSDEDFHMGVNSTQIVFKELGSGNVNVTLTPTNTQQRLTGAVVYKVA